MRTLLLTILATLPVLAAGQTLTDDFSGYADADALDRVWVNDSAGFSPVDGALVATSGVAIWQVAPPASAGHLSADLKVVADPGVDTGWGVAGIGFGFDAQNFWALQAVLAPAQDGQRRTYMEMYEMLAGQWQADTTGATTLPRTANDATRSWTMGEALHLDLQWAAARVSGTITAAGERIAHFAADLSDTAIEAVRSGRPILRVSGLKAEFDNVAYTAEQPAEEPPAPVVEVPAWVSRPGVAIAPGTGYFATALVDGRWWLVDPEGKPFWVTGTDHVRYEGHWCEALGYPPYSRVSERIYGSEDKWAAAAADRLHSWNFNSLGAGHSPSVRHRGLAHLGFASFGSDFAKREWIAEPINWTGFPNVFSADWPRWCRSRARALAKEMGTDPWCLGTFLDNELEWYGKDGHLVREVFRRGPEHTAKLALWDWLSRRYGGVAAINQVLGTTYADREAFLASTEVPTGPRLDEVLDGFLEVIAERYFQVACEAMKAADPHHLLWGSRFAGRAPESVIRIAGQYNDVFTINTYPRINLTTERIEETPKLLSDYYKLAQKPFVITEWSFPALDSGLPCKHGAGMRVDTQAQKALCYRIFANQMADLPFLVGYNYFMYLDEPALGISAAFPEDSNYGLINGEDEPYAELTAMATKVNAEAPARHAASQWPGYDERPDYEAPADGQPVMLANDTPNAVEPLFAVLDGPAPAFGRTPRLEPGQTWQAPPATATKPVTKASGDNPNLSWSSAVGDGPLMTVKVGDLELGAITVAAHQRAGGKDSWSRCNDVESLAESTTADGTLVDAVLTYGQPNTPLAFKVGVRAVVPTGEAVILVRPLWYESTASEAFELVDAFVFCDSSIGGDGKDDVLAGPSVPNYYRHLGAFTDPKLGGAFGAFALGAPWHVSYAVQAAGTHHPDALLVINRSLAPGERYTLPQVPYLLCFATADADGWRAVSQRWLAASEMLIVPAR